MSVRRTVENAGGKWRLGPQARRVRVQKAAGSLVAAALLLAACTAGAERYESVRDIVQAMQREGISCTRLDIADPAPPKPPYDLALPRRSRSLVKESGTCAVEGEILGVYVFRTAGDRDRWLKLVKTPSDVGPNWIVNARNQELARRVQEAVGGRLQAPSESSGES